MKAIQWTPEMTETAISMRLARKTLQEIGDALGMSLSGVRNYFDRLNLPELKAAQQEVFRRNGKTADWTPEMDGSLRDLRAVRATERDCAHYLRTNQTVIRNRLDFLGLPLDTAGVRRETCSPGDDTTWRVISPVPWADVQHLVRAGA